MSSSTFYVLLFYFLGRAAALPDPVLMPGATLPVTTADICAPGYSHKVRDVPAEVKREFIVDFESGSTLTLRTAEPTSSVLVRARDQTLEYAD